MNLDGSLVKRPKWLRIQEAEDLISAMDDQWVIPKLKDPPIKVKRVKKKFLKLLWNEHILVEFGTKKKTLVVAEECFGFGLKPDQIFTVKLTRASAC